MFTTLAVKFFQPKYRLGHPEYYLFLSSKKNNFRIKVSKEIFNLILKKTSLDAGAVSDCGESGALDAVERALLINRQEPIQTVCCDEAGQRY